MLEAARYSAAETTRDGRGLKIRALRPEYKDDMRAAVIARMRALFSAAKDSMISAQSSAVDVFLRELGKELFGAMS